MKTRSIYLAVTLIGLLSGCERDNLEERTRLFESCVSRAEEKYNTEYESMCNAHPLTTPTKCYFDITQKGQLVQSKDNAISACATMYAPRQ